MAATDFPCAMRKLALDCRILLVGWRERSQPAAAPTDKTACRTTSRTAGRTVSKAFYLSALALLGQAPALADDSGDDVGVQFSHYEEGPRTIYNTNQTGYTQGNLSVQNTQVTPIGNGYTPINADSEHAWGNFHLNDRTRIGFNLSQDVWSGATPQLIAPAYNSYQSPLPQQNYYKATSGATPTFDGSSIYLNNATHQLAYVSQMVTNNATGQVIAKFAPATQMTEILGYASPEVRNQGDMHFGYDWDHASATLGGGVSIEHDYLSRFANLAGSFDFNEKQTTLNTSVSYTNSLTHALFQPRTNYGDYPADQTFSNYIGSFLMGLRQDWTLTLGLTQVVSKNGLLSAGINYTNSGGYLANPYKSVIDYGYAGPSTFAGYTSLIAGQPIAEKRPGMRNQFTFDSSYLHYVEALDGAGKFAYSFFHDDWNISSHTFELEWRQNLPWGLTLTPHGRYYSQTAAFFFAPYFLGTLPQAFSSDQRLAAYGTLSGGADIAKDVARGLRFEVGIDYYTHQSALTLGGQGSGSYMDFNYYVANATLKADFAKLAKAGSTGLDDLFDGGGAADADSGMAGMVHDGDMAGMNQSGPIPAAMMFTNMMPEGEYMVGYRFMQQQQGNGYQIGAHHNGLGNVTCMLAYQMCNTGMTMNMHMLNLMYAPTDWLNLMLMPQYTTMTMDMVTTPTGMHDMMTGMGHGDGMRTWNNDGGIADTGMYAMFKLWEGDGHKLITGQGVSAPTGTINTWNELDKNIAHLYPADLQNSSGTWDYNPSLTYTGSDSDFSWGGQITGTYRLQAYNYKGWRYGNIFQGSAWGGYQWTDWLSNTLRAVYTRQGSIASKDPNGLTGSNVTGAYYEMPDDYAGNYGGTFVDVGFGLQLKAPKGRFAGNRLSAEWLQPLYTNYNGMQLERIGTLALTWGYMF